MSRQQTSNAAAAVAEAPAETTTEREPKERSDAARAATAFNKLLVLDTDEQSEIANAPQSIRSRFDERRGKVIAALTPGARALVEAMRGVGK